MSEHVTPPRWTRERWRAVEALLDAALDHSADERYAFLDRACAERPRLRSAVDSLLGSLDRSDGFLDAPIERFAPDLLTEMERALGAANEARPNESREDDRPRDDGGRRVGPWRILRRIGRGGMGTVHLAERADGAFEQTVAIKILRRGLDTEDIVARFVSERQILANLDHPNIARLVDGGATVDGRPYIVMEYVEGEPIDAWCVRRGAPLDERLDLFASVCDAVAYAHRSLVVHRDLKPSNILVTGDGDPKVVDFGIARILAAEDDGVWTRTGSSMWTPAYAAPEQILGKPVTTATDVWSLGAVLHHLLTGRPLRRLESLTPVTLERAAAEGPVRPSHQADPDATGIAVHRIAGDLDAIVTTATGGDPEKRYATAADLAADVRRHRDGLPVAAREPTRWYRLQKLVARRKLGVAALMSGLLLAFLYAATLRVQADRVAAERDRARLQAAKAERAVDFLVDLVWSASPVFAPEVRSAADLVDFGVGRADSAFVAWPDVHAEVLTELGKSAYWMGQVVTARRLLERAVQIVDGSTVAMDPMVAWWAHHYLATSQYALGEYGAAEATYRRALEAYGGILGPRSEPVGRTLNGLGWLYHETGDLDRAEETYREALAIRREALRARPTLGSRTGYATTLENLGLLFADRGLFDAAEPLVRATLAIRSEHYGPAHPNTAYALRSLGRILHRRGDTATAERLLRTNLAMRRHILGPTHHKFAEDLCTLGAVVAARGDLEESRQLIVEALAIRRDVLGEDHPVTAVTKHQLATIYHRRDDRPEAERLYGQAVHALASTFGPDHGWTAAAIDDLGRLGEGREPATRDWLSGTRLPFPVASSGGSRLTSGR